MVEQNVFGQGLRCLAMLCYAMLCYAMLSELCPACTLYHGDMRALNCVIYVSPGTFMILSTIYSSIPLIEDT